MSKFFVYYDEEGNILSITNEKKSQGQFLEVEELEVQDFLNGSKSFSQFKIHSLTTGNKGIKLAADTTNLVYKDFCYVQLNVEGEVSVTHNFTNSCWEIKLDSKLEASKMEFFICKNDDINFLIRSFVVDQKYNIVKFKSDLESKINDLVILTKKVYESYGLKHA